MRGYFKPLIVSFALLVFCGKLAFSEGKDPSLEQKREIFKSLGVCEKVITDIYGDSVNVACIYKREGSEECKRYINSIAEGKFSGRGKREFFLDIYDYCIPHADHFGELWYVVDNRLVKKFDRLGDFVELIVFERKQKQSLLLYRGGYTFQGQGKVYLGACELNPKTLNLKCDSLVAGDYDMSGFGKFLKDFSIDKVEFIDLNGDGQKDLVVETTSYVYSSKTDKLISKKRKTTRFVYERGGFRKLR